MREFTKKLTNTREGFYVFFEFADYFFATQSMRYPDQSGWVAKSTTIDHTQQHHVFNPPVVL
jgi:hypothetical protein